MMGLIAEKDHDVSEPEMVLVPEPKPRERSDSDLIREELERDGISVSPPMKIGRDKNGPSDSEDW